MMVGSDYVDEKFKKLQDTQRTIREEMRILSKRIKSIEEKMPYMIDHLNKENKKN